MIAGSDTVPQAKVMSHNKENRDDANIKVAVRCRPLSPGNVQDPNLFRIRSNLILNFTIPAEKKSNESVCIACDPENNTLKVMLHISSQPRWPKLTL